MLEKRVETISDDRWKKIIEDFQKLHEKITPCIVLGTILTLSGLIISEYKKKES